MLVVRPYVYHSCAHQIKYEALEEPSIFFCELALETNGHSFKHITLHLHIFQNIYFKAVQDCKPRVANRSGGGEEGDFHLKRDIFASLRMPTLFADTSEYLGFCPFASSGGLSESSNEALQVCLVQRGTPWLQLF